MLKPLRNLRVDLPDIIAILNVEYLLGIVLVIIVMLADLIERCRRKNIVSVYKQKSSNKIRFQHPLPK